MSKKSDSEENKHITRISASSSREKTPNQNEKGKNSAKSDDRVNTAVKAPTEPVGTNNKTISEHEKSIKKDHAKTEPKPTKKGSKSKKRAKNDLLSDGRKPIKEVKLIARPFVALGRYIHDSWSELCLVRWPDRKATWKMTFAVLAYCAVMMVFILLLDTLFTFLFNLAFK